MRRRPDHDAVFFARVPPMVPYEDLHDLFSRYGEVTDLNLFRRWQTAKTSKGCGIVKYKKSEQASAALLALNGVHTFDGYSGCEGPMVVEWMDASRLTSADAAAAQKAAKQREARAAAAVNKPHQHKPRSKGPTTGSSSNNSYSSTLPNWSYLQQLNALAQQNRSMAAAAAAAAAATAAGCVLHPGGLVGGPHPGVDALDLAGFMGGPLSPERFSSGLGDPSTWSTVIPAHMLPIISQLQDASGSNMGRTNLASLSPMLPSAAAAAAYDQMKTNHMLQSPAAAAAAAAAVAAQGGPSSARSGPSGYDQLQEAVSGPFSMLSIEPWFSGGLTSRSDAGSFTSPMPPPAFAGGSASFLQATGFEEQQQQMSPLMVFDDAWGSTSFNVLPAVPGNAAAAGQHTSSGTYALFDSVSLLSQLNEAATAAGASAAANAVHSNSILSGMYASAASLHSNSFLSGATAVTAGAHSNSILSGANAAAMSAHSNSFLSGPLAVAGGGNRDPVTVTSLGSRSSGFLPSNGRMGSGMPQQEGLVSARMGDSLVNQDGFPTGRGVDQQQKAAVTLDMPLGDAFAGQLVTHIPHIAKMSGADVSIVESAPACAYAVRVLLFRLPATWCTC